MAKSLVRPPNCVLTTHATRTICAYSDAHLCLCVPQNYMEAIKVAEEREAYVRSIFDKYDMDKSNSIDSDELLILLDDLGLVSKLKSKPEEFASDMFEKYDANGDGVLRCASESINAASPSAADEGLYHTCHP